MIARRADRSAGASDRIGGEPATPVDVVLTGGNVGVVGARQDVFPQDAGGIERGRGGRGRGRGGRGVGGGVASGGGRGGFPPLYNTRQQRRFDLNY